MRVGWQGAGSEVVVTVVEDRYSLVVGLVMFKCSGGGFRVFCASPLGLAGTDPLGFRVFCASPLGLACTDPLC